MSSKKKHNKTATVSNKSEQGFTMVEAVISIFILTIGLIGTAAALTFALEFGAISKNVTNGKLVIVSMVEEIESLRNSRRLDYKQIENFGKVNNTGSPNPFTGFITGFREVSLNPGADGVNGTNDDLIDPGADGKFGTADDFYNPALVRSGYMRQVTITNLSPSIKKIEVKVRYFSVAGKVGEITAVCYLNDEARITR
ncbi:MAG: type IV pilus modification PilV family protein [Aridibacter sp.]|jgi:competence protein ComGC